MVQGPAMQVMKAPENQNGWCPFVPRARATEPTISSFAADTAPVAYLIAGVWGEDELLQVSVRQPQPYLRAGASLYVARLMLAQKASLLTHTHEGSTAEVSCSISHAASRHAGGYGDVALLVKVSGSVQCPKHDDTMQCRSLRWDFTVLSQNAKAPCQSTASTR